MPVCSREYTARNGDSERISVVYRCRTVWVMRVQGVDEIAHCARNALGPTSLGPYLTAKVAIRPDKCRQGTSCISDAWGVKNSAARAVSRQKPSASSIRGEIPFRINDLARAAHERQRPNGPVARSGPKVRTPGSSHEGGRLASCGPVLWSIHAVLWRTFDSLERFSGELLRVFTVVRV